MPAHLPALPDLPVTEALPRLLDVLAGGRNAVLVAPPGAGKTTLVPLALLDAAWRGDGTILMLEPRRLATRAAATRMASLVNQPVGGLIGFRTRLESAASAATRVEVVTEGLLVRRLQTDPGLDGVAAVILDEIHERSLESDLALALCLDLQRQLRPELRLLAMSATADGARLSGLMDATVVESAGRMFPVTVQHARRDIAHQRDLPAAMAAAIRAALAEHQGDILAFLPGMAEIRRTETALDRCGALVLPLHGELPPAEQDRALRPAEGRRVVLATSIAETSLTVPGVRIVVDGGWRRAPRLDPSTGLTRLATLRISRAAADQRAGRSGREAPGVAIRLWSTALHRGLPAFDRPEILEAELSGLVLDCAAWGTPPQDLAFQDRPPHGTLAAAAALLQELGALDAAGRISEFGRRMARLGAHPRLAAMMLAAETAGEAAMAADLAALLEERDPLRGVDVSADIGLRLGVLGWDGRVTMAGLAAAEHGAAERRGAAVEDRGAAPDHEALAAQRGAAGAQDRGAGEDAAKRNAPPIPRAIAADHGALAGRRGPTAAEHGPTAVPQRSPTLGATRSGGGGHADGILPPTRPLPLHSPSRGGGIAGAPRSSPSPDVDRGALSRIRRGAAQYRRRLRVANDTPADGDPGRLLAAAFPDRIAQRRGEPGSFRFSGGGGAKLPTIDPLAKAPLLAVASLELKAGARIRLAAPLDPDDLPPSIAARVTEQAEFGFDSASGTVLARRRRRFGQLILSDRTVPGEPAQVADALADAVAADNLRPLPWSDATAQFRARVALMRGIEPDWPDLADDALKAGVRDWLAPHLHGMARLTDLQRLDMLAILRGLLPWALASRLDAALPTHLILPGGRAAVDYTQPVPLAAARAQHFYGMRTTPKLADGRIPLRLALLSPAQRPIAVTADIAGFWKGAWADARRDMRGRYPKHHWPEDGGAPDTGG